MTVTERVMGVGAWNLRLRDDTPRSVLDALDIAKFAFGHIVITSTQVDPLQVSDASILAMSTYTGVYRKQNGDHEFAGCGVDAWLGDEDDKGSIQEANITHTQSLAAWMADLIPGALYLGTVTSPGGNYGNGFAQVILRDAIKNVCDGFGVEWRVNPDFTMDVGPATTLYGTTPDAVIVRNEGDSGRDPVIRGLLGGINNEFDVEDFTTKVILLAKDSAGVDVSTTRSLPSIPFKNPKGADVNIERHVTASNVDAANAGAIAQANLNLYADVRREVTLSADEYDIASDLRVGQPIYVYDPLLRLVDTNNQVNYRGDVIFPVTTRVMGYTWPIMAGRGVLFRAYDGATLVYTDLTPYMVWEDGDSTIDIGANPRSLRDLQGFN